MNESEPSIKDLQDQIQRLQTTLTELDTFIRTSLDPENDSEFWKRVKCESVKANITNSGR